MKDTVEATIATFLAKYSPTIAEQLVDARSRLRAIFPRGFELVYNNYNALVFGISPREQTSLGMISIAGYPKWITLFFLHGAKLDDPNQLLEGSGAQVRSIRLSDPRDIDSAPIRALLRQAAALAGDAYQTAPRLTSIIKTVSAKQRARHPPEKSVIKIGGSTIRKKPKTR